MAAARCTLGFITAIFQNNKDSRPDPKLVVVGHIVRHRRRS